VPLDSTTYKHPEGHQNPAMPYIGEVFVTDAMLGEFELDKTVVAKVEANNVYQGLRTMPEMIGVAQNRKSYLYIPFNKDGNQTNVSTVGDVKISYSYAPSGTYSFAGKAYKNGLSTYTTENGTSLLFVRNGNVSAKAIFTSELDQNNTLTWILRVLGLALMYTAFTMLMGILPTLAKVIPLLGSFVGAFTSIISFVFTLLVGSTVIGFAWMSSRPVLALIVISVGVVVSVGILKFSKNK